MAQDDPTLDYLYLRQRQKERQKAKNPGIMTPEAMAMRVGRAVNPIAVARTAPYALASTVGNIGETVARMWSPYTGDASPLVQNFDQLSKSANERVGQIASEPGRGKKGGALVGSLIGGAAPYVLAGAGLPLGAAALASAGMTGLQAGAGRDASTVGMLADMTDDEGGTAVFERVANNPFARVAADVALDAAFSGIGPAYRALRGTGRAAASAPPIPFTPRTTPETNPARQLPSGRTDATAPMMGNQPRRPPDQPLTEPPVPPPDPYQRVVEPTTQDIPLGGSPRRRSAVKQQELMESVRRTAEKLERERRGNRAVPLENTDASAALAGAASGARNAEAAKRSPILDRFGNRAGVGALEAMNTLTGMGIGAGIGGTRGETAEERMRNAALGSLIGGVGAAGATALGRRALDMALDGVRRTSGELPTRVRPTPDVEFDDMMRTPMGPQPLDPLMDPQNSAASIVQRAKPERVPPPQSFKNRRGAIDLRTLFDWGNQREQPLLSRHDTHPSRIVEQLRVGGFPAPSIGIAPADAPSPGFGNASVLFKSSVTDPTNTSVFKGDAYTPRAPSESDIRMRPVLDFLDEVRSGKGEFTVGEVYGGPGTSGTPPLKKLLNLVHGPAADASTVQFPGASPRLNERLRQVLADALDRDWNPDDALALMKRSHPGDWRGRELMMTTDDSGDLLDVLQAARVTSPKSLRTIVTRPVQSVTEMREWANSNVPRVATSSNVSDLFDQLTQKHQNLQSRWYRAVQRVANTKLNGPPLDDGLIGDAVARAEAFYQRGEITKQDIPEYMYRLMSNGGGGPDWSEALPSVRAAYEALAREADLALEAPTKYLEAKPKRVLTPDDVAGIIVPESRNQGTSELLLAAKMRGIPVHNYVGSPRFGPELVEEDIRQAVVGANKFEAMGRNPYGFANPQVLATVAGAGGGALTGGTLGDTREERIRNAITMGLAGAGVGAGVGSLLKNTGGPPRKPPAPPKKPAGMGGGGLTPPDPNNMVPSLAREAIPGEGVREPRVRQSDAEVAELARALDTNAIVQERVAHMNPQQLKAVGQRIVDLRREAETLADELGRATPETMDAVGQKLEAAMDELLKYDEAFNAAASSQGRALRLVGKVVSGKGTLEAAVGAARRVLGVKQLSPAIMDQLRGVMLNPALKTGLEREAAMVRVLQQAQKLPWWRTVLDARRVGLLTSPVTWMVNTTGNIAEAANKNFIVTPTAAAFDAVFSAVTGKKRVVGMAGRGSGFASGATRGGQMVKRRMGQLMAGERPDVADFTEQGFDALTRNQVDYVRDVGDIIGKGPAKVAQGLSDVVFTAMDAADQPFYQAALDAAYAERAHLHAKNAGLKAGTRAYDEAVETMLHRDPDTGKRPNMSEADEIGAIWEALDDTFKTDVSFSKVLRSSDDPILQGVASWVVPFIKTPTNLIRKAFEATPGVGIAVNEAHLRGLKKKFAAAGIPEHVLADEMRRARTLSGAKQMSTGLGLVLAGFALTQAGMLSGEYVPAMGRSDEDATDASRKAVMNTPPLSITIDGTAHSLSAFAQFAPLLAFGHAIAQAVNREREAGENVIMDVLERTALSSARTIAEFPMLQGMKNLADLFTGEKAGDFGTYAGREAATLVPASAAVATLARLSDPIAKRKPEGFTQALMDRLPGLREQLPAKVGPMGEVTPRMDPLSTLFSPTRPQRTNTGPLYDALDATGFYPTAAPQGANESYADYSARRQQEGPAERGLLDAVLAGDPAGWSYVGAAARDSLDATGNFSHVLKSALSRQRTLVTRERQSRRPVP